MSLVRYNRVCAMVVVVVWGSLIAPFACSKRRSAGVLSPRVQRADAAVASHRVRQERRVDEALARIDERIAGHERRAAERADDWLTLEFVALAYMERAKVSGDYRDYRKAEDALGRAFRLAPAGAGPVLTRANLNYTLHRLRRVEDDLRLVERWAYLTPDQRASVNSLKADVAFHSGRYAEARAGYERALSQERSVGALVAMAQYQWKTGHFEEANALLVEADQVARGRTVDTRAWVYLVRGLLELDRGRWDEALAHYRNGLRLTPSSWLLQEHVAEILALQGHDEEARLMYIDIIERTGNPEYMDAIAEIYECRGDALNARRWVERAGAVYEQRLALYPEAAGGHALDHFLHHDPTRAMRLAEINRDARPGGEAQVKLAEAYLRGGRLRDARTMIEGVLSGPWNTTDTHRVAALVYAAWGDSDRFSEERNAAISIDPHSASRIGKELRSLPNDGGSGSGYGIRAQRTPMFSENDRGGR